MAQRRVIVFAVVAYYNITCVIEHKQHCFLTLGGDTGSMLYRLCAWVYRLLLYCVYHGNNEDDHVKVMLAMLHGQSTILIECPFYFPSCGTMTSRKKVLLKVIILGDSG